MLETVAEEVARLQREIAERQARLKYIVLGDPRKGVYLACERAANYFFGLPVTIDSTTGVPK